MNFLRNPKCKEFQEKMNSLVRLACRDYLFNAIMIEEEGLKSHFGMGVHFDVLHIFRRAFYKNTSGRLLL